ncbi:YczE/YyaS/YitT family protein [Sphingosinicella humi]|uniref:YitT family protein n=1 Tax=Allosphingosinicella humi TaxID=2068657 RepID=A0A2U2J3K4_9SPHN|nr:hypothetical protein [Sphingosinicella humi]PWG02908.1 hypothetical protein DF286_08525 [Sphingosinicella humi]
MTRRLIQLFAGLFLFGFSTALMLRANLGLNPWDVFHQGLFEQVGGSFGTVVIAVGAVVMLLWIPLRQRPGFGTIANMIVIGIAADLSLALLPEPESLPVRAAWLVAGIVLNGIAGGAYIGASLGPGPRDGLMTGLSARTGWTIRRVRTGIEVAVLAAGVALGGTIGLGTILYAVAIGPLVHFFLDRLTVETRPGPAGQPG